MRASRAGWTLAVLALAILPADASFCTSGLAAPSSNDPVVEPWPATAQSPLASWRERWGSLFGEADFLPGPLAARVATEPEQGFFGQPWNSAPAAPAGRETWFAPAPSAGTTRSVFTTRSSPGLIGPVTNTDYATSGDYVVDPVSFPSNTLTSIGAGDTLTIGGNLIVGANHTGSFSQSGGSVTVQASSVGTGFFLGANAGSSGTYTMTGGTLSAVNAYVGANGSGTMNQSAGNATFSNTLFVSTATGSIGTYNLSGGSLNAAELYVGGDGAGTLNQTGGAISIQSNGSTQGALVVGSSAGSNGTYNLGAGSISAQVLGIGGGGTGTFNQTGGTATSSASLLVGNSAGSRGTYNLSGGSLSTGTAGRGKPSVVWPGPSVVCRKPRKQRPPERRLRVGHPAAQGEAERGGAESEERPGGGLGDDGDGEVGWAVRDGEEARV